MTHTKSTPSEAKKESKEPVIDKHRELEKDLTGVVEKDKIPEVARIIAHREMQYSGPMPPASEMEKYKELYPDAPKYFFTSLEKEQGHRHSIEDAVVKCQTTLPIRGQWFGAFITLVCIGCAMYCFSVLHNNAAGGMCIAPPVIFVAITFIKGKNFIENSHTKDEDED